MEKMFKSGGRNDFDNFARVMSPNHALPRTLMAEANNQNQRRRTEK
jgi:hypothetical protein